MSTNTQWNHFLSNFTPNIAHHRTALQCLFFCLFCLTIGSVSGNGVGILDGKSGIYLLCQQSEISTTVENQIAVTTVTQTFINRQSIVKVKYAYPLPPQASATQLRWKTGDGWNTAKISSSSQDTSGTGQSTPALKKYLGDTPLYFPIIQPVKTDSILTVELTYVALLPYDFGSVSFTCPNNYSAIQTEPFTYQKFTFSLESSRTIDDIQLLSHSATVKTNSGTSAVVATVLEGKPAAADYHLRYTLNASQLGLFSFSTYLADSIVPDSLGRGFFVSVVEPNPKDSLNIIKKRFTLIIDRSGSMSGTKIVQARNAATFIINHLNPGDRFNIIDFDDKITSFSPAHVPFTTDNKTAALSFIAGLEARGSTDISGAFSTAIPQFGGATDSTANIVIFFTDGQPTAGITTTSELCNHIKRLNDQNEAGAMVFTFGIGSDVNTQLLSLIAGQNKGAAEFLGDNELESKITRFYLMIQNPVLLNTTVAFSPAVITEVYPNPLPNLYKGQQMIIVGRYKSPATVTATFAGQAFGKSVSYQYVHPLVDSAVSRYQFLPKIWAKRKVENLLAFYYTLDKNSAAAKEVKDAIVALSVKYGVVCVFTSFQEDKKPTPIIEKNSLKISSPTGSEMLVLQKITASRLRLTIAKALGPDAFIALYNSRGQLVARIHVRINGIGDYYFSLDGIRLCSDLYICVAEYGGMRSVMKLPVL